MSLAILAQNAIEKRVQWDRDYAKNAVQVASDFTQNLSKLLYRNLNQRLMEREANTALYFKTINSFSFETRFTLKFLSEKNIKIFQSLFKRCLPKKQQLPPFAEWISELNKHAVEPQFDVLYFVNRFKNFYQIVERQLRQQLRKDSFYSRLPLCSASHSYHWNPRLDTQLTIQLKVSIKENKNAIRTHWTNRFRESLPTCAGLISDAYFNKIKTSLIRRATQPSLKLPTTPDGECNSLRFISAMRLIDELTAPQLLPVPIASWVNTVKQRNYRPISRLDDKFFQPLLFELFSAVKTELENRCKKEDIEILIVNKNHLFNVYYNISNIKK